MTEYKSHPTVKDTPSRKERKHGRHEAFLYNKHEAKKEHKKQRAKAKAEKEKANVEQTQKT